MLMAAPASQPGHGNPVAGYGISDNAQSSTSFWLRGLSCRCLSDQAPSSIPFDSIRFDFRSFLSLSLIGSLIMEMVIGCFWRVDSLEGFKEESFRRWKLVLETLEFV